MTIAKVSKFTLFTPSRKIDNVSMLLHALECVEIIPPAAGKTPKSKCNRPNKLEEHIQSKLNEITNNIDKLKHTIDIIVKHYYMFAPRHGLSNIKYKVTPDEESAILKDFNWHKLYDGANNLLKEISALEIRKNALIATVIQLEPWTVLDVPLKKFKDTKRLKFLAGHIPLPLWENFRKDASEIPSSLMEVNRDGRNVYYGFIYPSDFSEKIKQLKNRFGYSQILIPYTSATPKRASKRFGQSVTAILKRMEGYHREIASFSSELPKLKVLYDYYLKMKNQIEAQKSMLGTNYYTYFYGWIVESKIQTLGENLAKEKIPFHIISEPASPGEDVPIVLENSKAVEPFEVVTDLYGKPNYRESDPTPLLSPFFVLFFGLCMADAAYGLIMTAFGLAILYMLKVKSARKFFKLIVYCGIATFLIGVMTGTYFGNLIDKFEFFGFARGMKQKFLVLDPLEDPLFFLGISLLLGIIQTLFGTAIKLYHTLKEKKYMLAFLSDLPTLLIQLTFPILILAFMFDFVIVPIKYSLSLIAVSAALIMLNQWILNEGIILKIFQMFFSVYGAITGNALSDPLSYSRLFALGLSTSLLAMAFNEISTLLFSIPYLGFLIGVFFLVIAHIFNIGIGSLGAYVHTSRLQYLEFFNKFFQGGGREMKPLRWEKKYTV